MKERINALVAEWKTDKLRGSLTASWIATVFSAFFGPILLPITLPGIGTIFLFRVLLPITTLLYILYAVRKRELIWQNASSIERWCYILIITMLIYGVASLPRALDFIHTFRQLFNLCFDLCFFFLLLRLCQNRRICRATLLTCAVSVVILFLLGVCQTLTAAPYDIITNRFHYFFFLNGIYMSPDICFANPNDYAASMVFAISILLLAMAAYWKQAGKRGYWGAVISFVLLYCVTVADGARLVAVSFWIFLAGFIVFLLISDRKRLWIPLVSLVLMSGVWFGTQYRYIMPAIRDHTIQLEPSQSLEEQFFITNEDSGKKELREDGSAGIRALLLFHAFTCFRESYGLGVGLGNTETLAPQRNVVPAWANYPQNSIHCFIARIIADFGIFVLIPLCIIALLLFKMIWDALHRGWQIQATALVAWVLLYFTVLLMFPFLSTASSDSQDMLSMWIYLGFLVLAHMELSKLIQTQNQIKECQIPID